MKRRFFLISLVFCTSALLADCDLALSPILVPDTRIYHSEHSATAEMDKQAKNMATLPDKALVYYYGYGSYWPIFQQGFRLYLDNKCVSGSIWPPGFYVWLLPPGIHAFEIHGSKISFNTTGGETYFIQQYGKFMRINYDLKIVDKETGSKHIKESQLFKLNTVDVCGRDSTPSEVDMRMKSLKPPEDKALVYIYRKPMEYDRHDATVGLDDRPPTYISAGTYLLWQIDPGTHTIGYYKEKLVLNTEASKTYYIRMYVVSGILWTWRYHFQEVDRDTGRSNIEDSLLMDDPSNK